MVYPLRWIHSNLLIWRYLLNQHGKILSFNFRVLIFPSTISMRFLQSGIDLSQVSTIWISPIIKYHHSKRKTLIYWEEFRQWVEWVFVIGPLPILPLSLSLSRVSSSSLITMIILISYFMLVLTHSVGRERSSISSLECIGYSWNTRVSRDESSL